MNDNHTSEEDVADHQQAQWNRREIHDITKNVAKQNPQAHRENQESSQPSPNSVGGLELNGFPHNAREQMSLELSISWND